MQNPLRPTPDQQTVTFSLHDIDQSGIQPAWNYNNTASYNITFYNIIENPQNIVGPFPTPLTDNPWTKLRTPPNGDEVSALGLANGGTTPWQPGTLVYYVEHNLDGSIGFTFGDVFQYGVSAGINLGSGINVPLPNTDIPYTYFGEVYYICKKLRQTFNYDHYLDGGRHILGFNADGTEVLHSDKVDRNIADNLSFVVWVQKVGMSWPEQTSIDLASLPKVTP